MMVEKMPNSKCCISSACKILSMDDLHNDEICASSSERKVLVKDMSPQQLRTPVSVQRSPGSQNMVLQGSVKNTSTLLTLFIYCHV